jgi:protein ImuA
MDRSSDVRALRAVLARLDPSSGGEAGDGRQRFTLGVSGVDAALGGGLVRGGVHEIYARGPAAPAAAGFALGLALRSGGTAPLVVIRQMHGAAETGELHAQGLAEMGIDPSRLVLVRVRDIAGVLRAGLEALHSPALGGLVMETWGDSRHLDLAASRRLGLAGAESGVTSFLLRLAAEPAASAADSRWQAEAAPSRDLPGLPGRPAYDVTLMRLRSGPAGREWRLEWDHELSRFAEPALSGAVAAIPFDRPAAGPRDGTWRKAG